MRKTLFQKTAKYDGQKADSSFYDGMEADGFLYQLVEGVLHMAPSPKPIHQELLWHISGLFYNFLRDHNVGRFYFAPFDVELNEKNIVQPDLLFVSKHRLGIITDKRVVGAPDLLIEILSDSSKDMDRVIKYGLYERSGVREYWIIDPDSQSFSFYQLEKQRYREIPVDGEYESIVLSPFRIEPEKFWQSLK